MNWEETNKLLKKINEQFVILHETPERSWTIEQARWARTLRKKCIDLQDMRYSILRSITSSNKEQ